MLKNNCLSTMKQYLPFLLFLAKFFGSYILLTLAYKFYLNQFDAASNELDGITQAVSNQVERSSNLLQFDVQIHPSTKEAATQIWFNDQLVAKIIEGCNSISVILLFAAFIIAFSTNWIRTAAYILLGSFIIYFFNILRIDWLIWALYYYPEQKRLLHDIVFPLIIYGMVLVLWLAWIFKFSKK